MRTTPVEDIVAVPALDRPFLEQWGDGPVTLLGDAAHPMLPSLGQGGSTAIEDAVVLAQCLASHSDPVAALRAYENTRRERTRFMVETSRKFAGFEQVENPVLCAVRDAYLRRAPQSVLFAPFQRALTPSCWAVEPRNPYGPSGPSGPCGRDIRIRPESRHDPARRTHRRHPLPPGPAHP
ncbi:FAD-dependent oxidoreductase [Streptomyces netropsis]